MAIIFRPADACPVPFVELNAAVNPLYHGQQFRADWFELSQLWWQRKVKYNQKWELTDNITIQFLVPNSNVTSVKLEVIDCNAKVVADIALDTSQGVLPDSAMYQYKLRLTDYDLGEGKYCFLVTVDYSVPNVDKLYISEPFFAREVWNYTKLIEYNHDRNEYNALFGLSPNFSIRVEAEFEYAGVEYTDNTYVDQQNRTDLLHAELVRVFELRVGAKTKYSSEPGVPMWLMDILAHIFLLRFTSVNGKQVVRPNGEAFDITTRTPTPLSTAVLRVYESNPAETTEAGTADLFIASTATYPYALSPLRMTDGVTTVELTGMQPVEILSGADETALLASLNAVMGITGTFSIQAGDIIYANGPTEAFNSASGITFASHSEVTITTGTSVTTYQYAFLDASHVLSYGSTVEYVQGPPMVLTSKTITGLAASTATDVRFYHNNNFNTLRFGTQAVLSRLTSVTSLPSNLVSLRIQDQDIPAFNLEVLNGSGNTLSQFILRSSNVESFTGTAWATPLPQFANLTLLDISDNLLDDGALEIITVGYTDNASYAHAGTWVMENQTPPAPPNVPTAASVGYLISAGWAVYTD